MDSCASEDLASQVLEAACEIASCKLNEKKIGEEEKGEEREIDAPSDEDYAKVDDESLGYVAKCFYLT